MIEAVLGAVCIGLTALLAWNERRYGAEREMLLQRIQSPDAAVAGYQVRQGKRKPIPSLPYDDDEAYKALQAQRKLSNGTDRPS
jgi:hypothetical protein